MKFRPCIDIHNGKVKQIVGGSLRDEGDTAGENFSSDKNADYYAEMFKDSDLPGGHVILLNAADSPYYEETKRQAMLALGAYPGGLQIGGGINPDNAGEYLDAGASHVIVTSYIFRDGKVDFERLEEMVSAVGSERLVLDLSCRKKDDGYHIVTDRWQKITDEIVNISLLDRLSTKCDEFLIHAADVEGKRGGIEKDLLNMVSDFDKKTITYAGGVHNFRDIELVGEFGKNRIDFTVGSALDIYGGDMSFCQIVNMTKL